MAMSWKDFLYFRKNDKNAIIMLFILIVVCGSSSIIIKNSFTPHNLETEKYTEFDNFQKGLYDIPLIREKEDVLNNKQQSRAKSHQPKLKQGETIDLNKANAETIMRIPGIGPSYADRIIDHRTKLRGFTSTEQLLEIKGISQKKYEKFSPYIRISKSMASLKINNATLSDLESHPYISSTQAKKIIQLRDENGKIKTPEELISNKILTPRDIDRLAQHLSFE